MKITIENKIMDHIDKTQNKLRKNQNATQRKYK